MAASTAPRPASPQDDNEPSYIDYETFLSPDFSATAFANSLVLATNNPQDSPLDLSTPLSRVLFDAQEIDSHIDVLTTRSAIPLFQHTASQTKSSKRIVNELDTQISSLNGSYKQLEKEVIEKHAEAEEVREVASRLLETLALGQSVARCLQLGKTLEFQTAELGSSGFDEDHTALTRCSYTLLSLREILDSKAPGEEGHDLHKVDAIRSLQDFVITPVERSVRETAERYVREFHVPGNMTFSQSEQARARLTSSFTALYLLSPTMGVKAEKWTPRLLVQVLDTYIRSSLQTSIPTLARSLGQLPSLDKALAEVTTKCQTIVALELILDGIKPPEHPLLALSPHSHLPNLLQPLLSQLETGSLASYFWRTMAGSVSTRVQDIINRGGVVARSLKANRNLVGDAIRQAVGKGSQLPGSFVGPKTKAKPDANWDREIAVMVGSVVNNLGR
ncbi:golgi transport complex component Cog5 [Cordyceps militaris]|uniref:Conserved oligomeric Golgi complex subunit 5 n=1 Tax=Cordyceps militaris TaxID=73501 RepID=A0A2H4SNW8_CORMI|nr:golgi transport complex component Cog5 [Cordyceps militaris]